VTPETAIDVAPFAAGAVFASDLRVEAIGEGDVVGCLGTDAAMLDIVSDLATTGHRVKVFDGHPRQLLPHLRFGVVRRAEALALTAVAVGVAGTVAATARFGVVTAPLACLRTELDDRSAAALRRRHVPDRWTRRQLTPLPFDRRPPMRHDRYLAAIASSRCELVTWPVASVTATGLRTCDGIEHRLDVLVVAGSTVGERVRRPRPTGRRRLGTP
jgi:cation diffusion facilitator CzcD-associated flavoprotein CzcO